jgi:membrane-bound lytic murein transglycosylase B
MKIKPPPLWMNLVSVIFFIVFAALAFHASAGEIEKGHEFDRLVRKLIQDGFDKDRIQRLFSSGSVFFDPDGVYRFFIHTESSLDYDQFTSGKSIKNAMQYMKDHKNALDRAQKIYGVDKTIITAILLVETRLGAYLGKRTVINTLSTMAALSDENLRQRVWNAIPARKKPKKEIFDKKVENRLKWGYEELKALLRYAAKEGIPPENIKGSYAGAMGIAQFMPSNALHLARDGNDDGRIDLFTHADAIFSVANYLSHHGWKPGIPRQRQHEVLFLYNHSNYYVDTLLKISDKLKS